MSKEQAMTGSRDLGKGNQGRRAQTPGAKKSSFKFRKVGESGFASVAIRPSKRAQKAFHDATVKAYGFTLQNPVPRETGSQKHQLPSTTIIARFLNDDGFVVVDEVADWFGVSQGQLAETVGMRPETFHRWKRVTAAKTQNRVKEMLEIVGRVADWAGGKDQALAWYRAVPIPAFGGRTAESLVKDGKATDVRDYLDHVALGGFA